MCGTLQRAVRVPCPLEVAKGGISERFIAVHAGLIRAYALARDPDA
jgi:hypothetical protein